MKKTLVCMVLMSLVLFAKVSFASNEGVIYTQNFEQFTQSADGSAAPNGLSVLNCQGIQGGSGVYAADEAYAGSAVIKTNAECGNVSLVYSFPASASVSFVYETTVILPDFNTDRTITVTNGEESADIVTIKANGNVYAGETLMCGFKSALGKKYKIRAAYTPENGRVTLKVEYNFKEYIAQGTVELESKAVKTIGIRSAASALSQTYVDDISVLYTYEYDELIYADNFDEYDKSQATSNSRWPKINLSYTSATSDMYGTNMKITKTVSNDANVETAIFTSDHYIGEDDIHYNLSLKFDDFNCIRRFTVRDSSPTTSYKYAYTIGYIDMNGCLYWNGVKQDYSFETNAWYDIAMIYNRVTGDCDLTVSDSSTTFICKAKKVRTNTSVTRVGIELNSLSGTSSVMYIDNVSLWIKPEASEEVSNKTNWFETELNSLSTIRNVDTAGRAVIKNGSSMVELATGEYINYLDGSISPQVFVADIHITAPVNVSISGDTTDLISFTSDFKIKSGSTILGNYTKDRTYRIFITNDSSAPNRYISVSENKSRLVGFVKVDASKNQSFKILNNLNKVYIDSIGFAQSGTTVYPISITPENRTDTSGSVAEFIFPQYIDSETVNVFVNGVKTVAEFSGDKTIRINNLSKDSYYHIAISGYDLLGNSINADVEFNTLSPKARVKLPWTDLKTGINFIKFVVK